MTTLPRGFAFLRLHDPDRMREIARSGGRAATRRHRFTSEEAREASRKAWTRKLGKKTEGDAA